MRIFRYLFDPYTFAGMLIVAFTLFGTITLIFLGLRGGYIETGIPTAAITLIAAPTPTPTTIVAENNLTPTGMITSIPQGDDTPPEHSEDISIGMIVQVSGTGGDGLRFRDSPGLDGVVKFLGLEAEVFQVIDGPREAAGFTWWQLVALYDESIKGWAVANYLKVVQNP